MDSNQVTKPLVDPFRQLLQSVASDITNEDLANFKFLCESQIPKGKLEKIARPLDLFSVLIEHNLISSDQKDFLISIFDQIGRQDLSKRILNKQDPTELSGSTGHSDRAAVDRDAGTKENEVNQNEVTKETGDVDRDATTKEPEGVDREAATREPIESDGIVRRDAATVESDAEVDRENATKDASEVEEPTRIIFFYSNKSDDLLRGLPKLALQKNVNVPILFGRGKGIENHGVFLNDETASRKHLQLTAIDAGHSQIDFFLDVVGKAIQINNQNVKSGSKRIKLNNNDELKVGQLNFKIQIIPGNDINVFVLEFARAREQQMVNGPFGVSGPVAGNPAFVIDAANLQSQAHLAPIQGPQFFQQQAQGLYFAGAPGVPGIYPYMTQGYASPVAPPNLFHVPPGQRQPAVSSFQSPAVHGQFPGGSVLRGGAVLPQAPVPHDYAAWEQADPAKRTQTAQDKRDAYQSTKKQPSEHVEDEEESLRAVTRSIEETHFPKCEE